MRLKGIYNKKEILYNGFMSYKKESEISSLFGQICFLILKEKEEFL